VKKKSLRLFQARRPIAIVCIENNKTMAIGAFVIFSLKIEKIRIILYVFPCFNKWKTTEAIFEKIDLNLRYLNQTLTLRSIFEKIGLNL
jgi:hypothetical protein